MEHRAALEAIGVSKRYGHRGALSSVDLVAEPGQLHGLLGPNGAGKTTLMRVLLGVPTEYSERVVGVVVAGQSRLPFSEQDDCPVRRRQPSLRPRAA